MVDRLGQSGDTLRTNRLKRVLVVTFRVPFPLIDGMRIRSYHIGKILAQKYQMDLLAINEGGVADEHLKELEQIFNKVIVYPFHPIRFKINTLKGLLSRASLQIYYHHFGKVQKWIDRHYADYDLIFCFHIRMTRYLRKITDRPKIIDFIDATSINYREAQKRARGIWKFIYPIENRRVLAYELQMLRKFDRAFISSPFDKVYLDENCEHSDGNLTVIPNAVKEELFFRTNRFGGKEEDWLVFLGTMNYAPNVDAVIYFAKEVFPLVRKKTGIKFLVVGSKPAKEVLKLQKMEGVEVTGFVEDPYEYLERAKVVIAPLRFSAGSQYKILEAMTLKKPVITTSKGARGIAGEDGKHFIVVDDEEEMAAKILELLDNEPQRREIGKNARQLMEEKYRWDITGERFLKEIEDVLKMSR